MGLKEIKRRLSSVNNTKKITYAMKLVSAAKLKKSQEAVQSSREYTNALNELLRELLAELDAGAISHPLMEAKAKVSKIRYLIIGGNRGLSGAYNANINKAVEAFLVDKKKSSPEVSLEPVIIGKKPADYFRRKNKPYLKSYEDLVEDARQWPVEDICKEFEMDFLSDEVDEVYAIYTKFKSAMSMNVMVERLLPMDADLFSAGEQKPILMGKKIFEPSPDEVFSAIIPRIMRSRVRQFCLDAKASEFGSRMTAMDAATKNAGELADKLKLTYNNLRQANITSELLDIIGGAEAIS